MFTFYNLRFLFVVVIMASTARLRRTFQYPNDSDSDAPEAMDEQGMYNICPCTIIRLSYSNHPD